MLLRLVVQRGFGALQRAVSGAWDSKGRNFSAVLVLGSVTVTTGDPPGCIIDPPKRPSARAELHADQLYPLPRYYVGYNNGWPLVADFDNDGNDDVFMFSGVREKDRDRILMRLLGRGDGTFEAIEPRPVPGLHRNIWFAVDIDQDGATDIVYMQSGNNLSTLLGNGDGTFEGPFRHGVVGTNLVLVDVSGDSIPDVVHSFHMSSEFAVRIGNGDGTYQPDEVHALPGVVGDIAATDTNGDGHVDIVATARTEPFQLLSFLGGPEGFTSEPVVTDFDGGLHKLRLDDLDGDGFSDGVGFDRNDVVVLRGLGDGTFTFLDRYAFIRQAYDIFLEDMDGDGNVDVATIEGSRGLLRLQYGNGDGTFQPVLALPAGFQPSRLATGNFNDDGLLDIVVTDNAEATIMLGDDLGTFSTHFTVFVDEPSSGFDYGDLNLDGIPDFATKRSSSGVPARFFLSRTPDQYDIEFLQRGAPELFDINGDGFVDILQGYTINRLFRYTIRFSNGDGTFQAPENFESQEVLGYGASTPVDLNEDGYADFYRVGPRGPTISTIIGDGLGHFTRVDEVTIDEGAGIPIVGDFNGDSIPDTVFNMFSTFNIGIVLGAGDGLLGSHTLYPQETRSNVLVAGDFNDDGLDDFAFASDNGYLIVMTNLGDLDFHRSDSYGVGRDPFAIQTADVNDDGILDLVTANVRSADISVLLGNGDGTFQRQQRFLSEQYGGPGDPARYLVVTDQNQDAVPDIITRGTHIRVLRGFNPPPRPKRPWPRGR